MEGLQLLADALAERLMRSVEVDDLDLLPLALTAQHGKLDQTRVDAVLHRRSPPAIIEYAFQHGIRQAVMPVRIPPHPRLGTLPRLCIPLRHEHELHGYLWLIDADPPLDDAEIAAAQEAAAEIAVLLGHTRTMDQDALSRHSRLINDILRGDTQTAVAAVASAQAADRMPAPPMAVVMLSVRSEDGHQGRASRPDLRRAAALRVPPQIPDRTLFGMEQDRALAITTAGRVDRCVTELGAFVDRAASGRGLTRSGTGIGSSVESASQLRSSFEQAEYAARVSGAQPERGAPVRWTALGIDLAFAGLDWDEATMETLHPGSTALREPGREHLREAVLAFLECGGDTRAAAELLNIHRTTLYYRLDRARPLLGIDWRNGRSRAGLHLALRLSQLIDGEQAAACGT